MATDITIDRAETDIRGGGYGSSAWIAKITGTHPKYGLQREFMRKDKSGMSGSGRSGVIRFEMAGPGIYEFRDFCVGSTANNWNWSGYLDIDADGGIKEITKAEAVAIITAKEAVVA